MLCECCHLSVGFWDVGVGWGCGLRLYLAGFGFWACPAVGGGSHLVSSANAPNMCKCAFCWYSAHCAVPDALVLSPVLQIFFHCPDNHMIEVCNCDCLPIEILREKSCEMQTSLSMSCLLQHQKTPSRSLSRSIGSMDLSDMHYDTPVSRPVQSEAA